MTAPFRIVNDYRTSKDELRIALSGAMRQRRLPLGFILGLIGTFAIAIAAAAFYMGFLPGS